MLCTRLENLKNPFILKWVIIGQETGNRKERIKAMPEWINGIHKAYTSPFKLYGGLLIM